MKYWIIIHQIFYILTYFDKFHYFQMDITWSLTFFYLPIYTNYLDKKMISLKLYSTVLYGIIAFSFCDYDDTIIVGNEAELFYYDETVFVLWAICEKEVHLPQIWPFFRYFCNEFNLWSIMYANDKDQIRPRYQSGYLTMYIGGIEAG